MDEELTRYRELDAELVSLVKDIKMLSTLSWPKRVQDRFLADWRAGKHELPQIEYKKFNYAERRHALKNIARQNAETLDQIRQFVTADGTRTAEIQSANAEGDQVQGRLRIAVPAAAAAAGRPGGRA